MFLRSPISSSSVLKPVGVSPNNPISKIINHHHELGPLPVTQNGPSSDPSGPSPSRNGPSPGQKASPSAQPYSSPFDDDYYYYDYDYDYTVGRL